jgi:hypothetical protein
LTRVCMSFSIIGDLALLPCCPVALLPCCPVALLGVFCSVAHGLKHFSVTGAFTGPPAMPHLRVNALASSGALRGVPVARNGMLCCEVLAVRCVKLVIFSLIGIMFQSLGLNVYKQHHDTDCYKENTMDTAGGLSRRGEGGSRDRGLGVGGYVGYFSDFPL